MQPKTVLRRIPRSTFFKFLLCTTLFLSIICSQNLSTAAIARATPTPHEFSQKIDPHIKNSFSASHSYSSFSPSKNHELLLSGSPRDAKAWINKLSTTQFEDYLEGLSFKTLIEIGINQEFRKGTETGLQLQQLNSMTEINRRKYIEFIVSSIERKKSEFVRDLKPGASELMLDFAHDKGIQEQDPSKLSVEIVLEWQRTLAKQWKELADKFPLHDDSES